MLAPSPALHKSVQVRVTPTAFALIVNLPEYQHSHLELIEGELRQKMVSSPKSSALAMRLAVFVGVYVIQHRLGRLTGADGGYWVGDERYIPDMGFLRQEKIGAPVREGYITVAPDLALEVISPTDDSEILARKVKHYVAAGTLVWVANVADRSITVYAPNAQPQRLTVHDTLTGGEVLPTFTLDLATLFTDEG